MIQVNRIYLIFNRLVTKKFLVDTSVIRIQRNKKEITVIANEGYGTLIIGTDNIIAGQHCIYINETDNKIEFKQYSDVMNVTFGGIIA